MAEYIERKAAVTVCDEQYKECLRKGDFRGDTVAWNICADIKAIPAADVAPVTRCKDCKYLVNATVNDNGFLICDISDMEITPDDFCSYGEPKGDTHADNHD